jgi:hypothetical protein
MTRTRDGGNEGTIDEATSRANWLVCESTHEDTSISSLSTIRIASTISSPSSTPSPCSSPDPRRQMVEEQKLSGTSAESAGGTSGSSCSEPVESDGEGAEGSAMEVEKKSGDAEDEGEDEDGESEPVEDSAELAS